MNLTRHNYEEYFLLYTDNELEEEERRWVEQFVKENPDLEEAFHALQHTVLDKDELYPFAEKQLLYRTADEEQPPAAVPLWGKWLPAVAAAVFLLGAGAFWLARAYHGDHGIPPQATVAEAPKSAVPAQSGVPAQSTVPAQSGTPPDTVSTHGVASTRSVAVAPTVTPSPATRPHPATATAIRETKVAPAHGTRIQDNPSRQPETPLDAPQPTPTPVIALTQATRLPPPTPAHPDVTLATPETKNNPSPVTIAHTASYHTLQDTDQPNDGNKILFVRTDQVLSGSVKGFLRKASRLIKRSTAPNSDNIHPETDSDNKTL